MSYHIYRVGDGCKWIDDFQEAVDHFKSLPEDKNYTAIGISEGGYAVDVVIKGAYAGKCELFASMDIKQSMLFQENQEKTMKTLKKLYDAVGVRPDISKEILDDLSRMADELDDLEEM